MNLDPSALAFVLDCPVAHLATSDTASGQPHVVPICFALIDDVVYFIIDHKPKRSTFELRRLKNIRQNPRVAVLWDRYDADWKRLAYLLAFGRARIATDKREWERALIALRARYKPYEEARLEFEHNPAVAIEVLRYHFWRAEG